MQSSRSEAKGLSVRERAEADAVRFAAASAAKMEVLLQRMIGDDAHARTSKAISDTVIAIGGAARTGLGFIALALSAHEVLPLRDSHRRLERLLRNPKLGLDCRGFSFVRHVLGSRTEALVALDWTDFEHDKQTTLCAYLATMHGRATPLWWKTVAKKGLTPEERIQVEDEVLPGLRNAMALAVQPGTGRLFAAPHGRDQLGANWGFTDEQNAELPAENAKMFEKGDREYVKARLKEFRQLTADTRKLVDDLEKEAGKWSTAKDPQKAFDKTGEALGKRAKDQQKALDKLSEKNTKGSNTLVLLLKAFRPLEELQGALGPEIGKDEKFAEALKTIRAALHESDAAFTEIEKDETLIASKFAKTGEDAAKEDEGAKPASK